MRQFDLGCRYIHSFLSVDLTAQSSEQYNLATGDSGLVLYGLLPIVVTLLEYITLNATDYSPYSC
jgi:hypothetical protein